MSAPDRQCVARSLSLLPESTLSHTSRDIKYIFLDGCKNITASHTLDGAGTHKVYKASACHPKMKHKPSTATDCCPSLPKYHPTFATFPMHLEKQAMGSGHFPVSKKRLPVFQKLCEEAVPGMYPRDVHLLNSNQELKEMPDAKAPREDTKGWMMRQTAGSSPHNKS